VFSQVKPIPPDPILGVIAAHAADPNPQKIDLGVGVYRDKHGATPILSCVAQAEKVLLDTQTTKTYLGPAGVPGFNEAIGELLFGADSPALAEGRVVTTQTPGGTGALRLAADLIHASAPAAELWASDPTWSNHYALFPAAGVTMHKYPYFDWQGSGLLFDEMAAALEQRGPGDVVLFHACCHNPSGVSPDPDQWRTIADIAAERGFTPLIDIAYMGLETGQEQDCLPVRLLAERCPELIVASSCSKNFAMYRERVGALSVVARDSQQATAVGTVINSITRANYSMPPSHGPAVVDIILHSDELTALWDEELGAMRDRINGVRKTLSEKIAASGIERDFSFLADQSGMFSFLGINREQIQRLRSEYSIYMVDSSRINVASFNDRNMDYFVTALEKVIRG
jgi:aspartate aminotransferase